jgi:hypothetical protein
LGKGKRPGRFAGYKTVSWIQRKIVLALTLNANYRCLTGERNRTDIGLAWQMANAPGGELPGEIYAIEWSSSGRLAGVRMHAVSLRHRHT